MATPVSDYTSLDYDSLKADLEAFAQEKYGAEGWTDFNDDQFAVMLLDLVAYAGDLGFFQVNALVKETIVKLLTRSQNLRNIGRYLDYSIPSAVPSTVSLLLTLNAGALPYTLPTTFQFSTDDPTNPIIFQPTAPNVIAATPATILAVQGVGVVQESVGTSNGAVSQSYQLANPSVIDGTLTVYVNGIAWTQFTNFADMVATDQGYVVSVDENNVLSITFGDGTYGQVPPNAQLIKANYTYGGGGSTNVASNSITKVVTPSTTVLTVNNPSAATGGADSPTVSQSKIALPASFATQNRSVNALDYAAQALNVPGVAKAIAQVTPNSANQINLFIAPNGGGNATSALQNKVLTALSKVKMLGTKINLGNAFYQDLLITIDLYVLANARQADVLAALQTAVLNAFLFNQVDFGGVH